MKNKILILFLFLILPISVKAAGTASISAYNSVEVGSKVTATVTLRNTASWNIRISSSGSTSGCSQNFADATTDAKNATKQFSVVCKATGVGAIVFTVTGDITSADGTKTNVSLSKRVTVTEVRPKSTDSTLASLSIDGYDLNPSFSKDTLEYSIKLPPTVNSIKIAAQKNESHATLEGTGEFEVSEGINVFKVVVTAENGSQRTYVLNVNVEDENPIDVKINDKNYTLIKNSKNLVKPELYEETTVKINDIDIPAFYSDITKFILVGIKNVDGDIFLAIYNDKDNNYKIYNEFSANSSLLYIVEFPNELENYLKDTIKINNVDVDVYRYNENSRFVICYAMDVTNGEYNYYTYDTVLNTYQIYDNTEVNDLYDDLETYKYVCIAFGVGLAFSLLLIICLLSSSKKNKKQIKNIIKEQEKQNIKKDKSTNKEKNKSKKEIKENLNDKNPEYEEEETEMYDILETLEKKKKKRK